MQNQTIAWIIVIILVVIAIVAFAYWLCKRSCSNGKKINNKSNDLLTNARNGTSSNSSSLASTQPSSNQLQPPISNSQLINQLLNDNYQTERENTRPIQAVSQAQPSQPQTHRRHSSHPKPHPRKPIQPNNDSSSEDGFKNLNVRNLLPTLDPTNKETRFIKDPLLTNPDKVGVSKKNIGINTKNTTFKNGSTDIRGDPIKIKPDRTQLFNQPGYLDDSDMAEV
ncbi:Hypothetical protein MVR_LOCUS262 [uncultured virus]|nr:Hypothetical protein MVR_LOCUS262 [uncultured virus]